MQLGSREDLVIREETRDLRGGLGLESREEDSHSDSDSRAERRGGMQLERGHKSRAASRTEDTSSSMASPRCYSDHTSRRSTRECHI